MSEATHFLVSHGAPLLFAVVFLEQIGLPLPTAPWLLGAGALWAMGMMNPFVAFGVTVAACLVADLIWFYLMFKYLQRRRLSRGPGAPVIRRLGPPQPSIS